MRSGNFNGILDVLFVACWLLVGSNTHRESHSDKKFFSFSDSSDVCSKRCRLMQSVSAEQLLYTGYFFYLHQ